ncbi:leucyl aminopeptidase [Paenibacillaceae bacterium]|nr:leucyl aminopeptidase [Paenibacillaceae bacterium]
MATAFTYNLSKQDGLSPDLVIRFVQKEQLEAGQFESVHPQLDEALKGLYARGAFHAKPQETVILPTLGVIQAPYAAFIGLEAGDASADELRSAGAAAAKAAARLKAASVSVLLADGIAAGTESCSAVHAAQAFTEGFVLALHGRQADRKAAAEPFSAAQVEFVPDAGAAPDSAEATAAAWKSGIARGAAFAAGVCFARDLTNRPGNLLTPEALAEEAEQLSQQYELECEVLDEWSAAEQGMGALLGVGQGSVNPPRMIVIHYNGAPDDEEKWGLIGKGITFDTGGISLKKAPGMEEMISDMGGAAAVLGAMRIIAELRPAVNVVAVIPSAENMPSDRALKPGDVITSMNGLTIEVVNTDAEGRLVLADGLTTAIRRGATRLIDVATLTGAVGVALGDLVTGAVSNNSMLQEQVIAAGMRSGERIWPFPTDPGYRKLLHSDAADLKNSGGRHAGTITGGLFIGAFAEDLPWVHLDIAGTAWLNKERGWEPKGATGVMARTLAELLL